MKAAKKYQLGLVVLFACVLAASMTPRILFQELLESLLIRLWPEETVLSAGYSWKAWNGVNVGDLQEKVLRSLGEPLNRSKEKQGTEAFFYSLQGPHNTNYRIRVIVFDSGGRVIKKEAEYYLD